MNVDRKNNFGVHMSQTDSHCFGNAAECSTLQVHNLYNFMTRCTNWADIIPYPTSPACPACPSSLPFTSSTYIHTTRGEALFPLLLLFLELNYLYTYIFVLSLSLRLSHSLSGIAGGHKELPKDATISDNSRA